MAKPPTKPIPRKALLPPSLRDFVLDPESKKELTAILNSRVFIAACAYVADLSNPKGLFDTVAPDNLLNRKCAYHRGQDDFYEALAKIVTTKKTDPIPDVQKGWGEAQLNPNA